MRKMLTMIVSVFSLILVAATVHANEVVNATSRGIAMDGFDPVAYFKQGSPAKGDLQFSHHYKDRTWVFASAENRDEFAADPAAYEPQNNGWCAWAVSNGYAAEVDWVDGWFIVDDKLHVTWSEAVKDKFVADQEARLTAMRGNWDTVHQGLQDGTVKFVAHAEKPEIGIVHPQQLP